RPPPHTTLFPYTTLFRSSTPSWAGSSRESKRGADGGGPTAADRPSPSLSRGPAVGRERPLRRDRRGAARRESRLRLGMGGRLARSEEHTSELQSRENLVC